MNLIFHLKVLIFYPSNFYVVYYHSVIARATLTSHEHGTDS